MLIPSEMTDSKYDDQYMGTWTTLEGQLKMTRQFNIEGEEGFEGGDTLYKGHYAFVVDHAASQFTSSYAGYYGLGPVEDFRRGNKSKWNMAYEMKS